MNTKELTQNPKLQKIASLYDSLNDKTKLYRGKSDRAKKWEKIDMYHDLSKRYRLASNRAIDLSFKLGSNKRAFQDNSYIPRLEYKGRLAWKQKRKEEFESRHRYSPWFMQLSLGADYGTFQCERCGRTFYHSPSKISMGTQNVHECCCGNCTNSIIYRDWNEEPYS